MRVLCSQHQTFLWLAACLCSGLLGIYVGMSWVGPTRTSFPQIFALFKPLPAPCTSYNYEEPEQERQERLQLLTKVSQLLAVGHRYARSSKTMKSLEEAYLLLSGFLKADRVPFDLTPWRNQSQGLNQSIAVNHKRTVCPEVWKGMKYGYPFYYTGYEIEDCDYGRNMSELVTVLLATPHSTNVLNRVLGEYPDIPILMATYNATNQTNSSPHAPYFSHISGFSKSIVTVPFGAGVSEGAVWNGLISRVTTPYVLIARGNGFVFFDDNSRLHRLIRLIEYTDASVVGGSHRNSTGHWKIGCYQTKMRNYALRLVEGYDLAQNSCVYCEYVSGPFLARTTLLKEAFALDLHGDFLFLDLFSRWGEKTIAVCPDSLFFTAKLSQLEHATAKEWLPFVDKWDLNRVILPDRSEVALKCSDMKPNCRKAKGMSTHPCCLKELSDMLKLLFHICETHKVGCEIEAGTIVGGVKFYGTLPWELDSDLNYLGWNHTILKSLIPEFKKAGYSLTSEEVPKCKPVNEGFSNCGYWGLRSAHWRIELWGTNQLGTRRLSEKGLDVRTLVLVDGQWFPAYPNPALFARNLYGDDTFEHVEHWSTLGYGTGWKPYKTGSFLPCPTSGHHACLNQFIPVGNLQLLDIWL